MPQVVSAGTSRKKKLSPEAIETIEEMQRTPRDVFGTGVGSAAQSTALGGAVGAGLGYLGTGITQAGLQAPLTEKGLGTVVAESAKPSAEQIARKAARGKLIRRLGLVGAGAGLGTNIYYQARKKGLQKKLETALGIRDEKGKKKQGSDLLTMAATVKARRLLGV